MNKKSNQTFEEFIISEVRQDIQMMKILEIVQGLQLPDCWIGAGFIRNKIWDILHGVAVHNKYRDIDIAFFDQENISSEYEKETQSKLTMIDNTQNWEVINQARTHIWHEHAVYKNSKEAISHWVETATCIAIKLNHKDELEIIAPHGLYDLENLLLRPVPSLRDMSIFKNRIKDKNWLLKWPKLKVINTK